MSDTDRVVTRGPSLQLVDELLPTDLPPAMDGDGDACAGDEEGERITIAPEEASGLAVAEASMADEAESEPPLSLPATYVTGPALPPEHKEWRVANMEFCWRIRRGRTHQYLEDRVAVVPLPGGGIRMIVIDGVSYKVNAPDGYGFVETALKALVSLADFSPGDSLCEADMIQTQFNARFGGCWTGAAALVIDVVSRKNGCYYLSGAAMGDCIAALWHRPWWSLNRRLQLLSAPPVAGPIQDCLGMKRQGEATPVLIPKRRLRHGDALLLATDGAFPIELSCKTAGKFFDRLSSGFGLDSVSEAFFRESRMIGADEDDMSILLLQLRGKES